MSAADEAKLPPAIPNSFFCCHVSFPRNRTQPVETPLKGIAITMKMRQNLFRSGQLHSWLVVSLSLLFIVGEPAILRAGPCEDDCENKKAKALAACDITFSGNETKCLIQATGDQRICNVDQQLAIVNAEWLYRTTMETAATGHVVAQIICAWTVNPVCAGVAFATYQAALAGAELTLIYNLNKSSRDADACNKKMLSNLGVCRQKRDTDRDVAVKIAIDDCARCKKNNCGGNNNAGDNGGG